MKKIFLLPIFITLIFLACEKRHEKDNICPTVAAASVPKPVIDSFSARYKGAVVDTWYNKDNAHIVAKFTNVGKITFASFTNNGNFENEQIEGDNQQGNHQDNNQEGCDCGGDHEDGH